MLLYFCINLLERCLADYALVIYHVGWGFWGILCERMHFGAPFTEEYQ